MVGLDLSSEPLGTAQAIAGPPRRKFSAEKSPRPGKPPADGQRAGRVIGFEGGEESTPGKSPSSRPPSSRPPRARPSGTGPGRRPHGTRIGVKPRRARRPRPQTAPVGEHPSGKHLQKILAAAGLGSRGQCEELITTGRVEVNRKVVTQLGTRVDPAANDIRVDGESLSLGRRVYYAVNKTKGVVTTNRDPARRPRVIDLVPNHDIRLFAIGRLDLNSEGLILVTNDGELANRPLRIRGMASRRSTWPRSRVGRRRRCSTSCGEESIWPKGWPAWRTSASNRTRRRAPGWRSRFARV